jgi:glucosamine--fructose-6-phosphate aminotransferase (isomerizing)
MCGIVGYIGKKEAFPILLSGLKRILYRGYDSFGWAILDSKGEINYFKTPGKFNEWEERVAKMKFEGKVGIAHCLSPDTLVQMADGRIVEISKIENGEKVLVFNPKNLKFSVGKVKVFKHKSPEYLYEIKTPSTSLLVTPFHRMLVFENGEIKEKKVENLSLKDLLIFPKRIKIKGKKIKFKSVPLKRYYKISEKMRSLIKNKLLEVGISQGKLAYLTGTTQSFISDICLSNRAHREDYLKKILPFFSSKLNTKDFILVDNRQGKLINLPKESSPQLMQLIGYFLGDGDLGKNYLRFKDENKYILEVYRGLIKKIFGLESEIKKLQKKKAFLLETFSKSLADWFRENIFSRKNEFLEELGKLPNREISAFLRGIFDAEGTVAISAGQVSLDMTNKHLMRIIQFLFLRLGIPTSLLKIPSDKKNWQDRYRINLSNSESIQKFLKFVGFTSWEKQAKVRMILKTKRKEDFRNFKIIPFRKKEIYNLAKKYLKTSEFSNLLGGYFDGFITKRRLSFFLKSLKRKVNQKPKLLNLITQLQKFSNAQILFQPLIEKRKVKSSYSYLYDLEVMPHHNFIANGLLSHNSRWATHGSVCEANTHPFWDCTKNIFLVHNGIIENYKELKEKLIKEGHKFSSETDTEIMVHLIEKYFNGNLEEAVRKMLKDLRGAYAIAVISKKDPQKIVAARMSSPLLLGINKDEFLVASDPNAILIRTRQVINLDDGEIAVLKPNDFFILKEKPIQLIEWTPEQAEKGGYPHFMLKEIFEEPEAIENAIRGRLIPEEGNVKLGGLESVKEKLKKIEKIILVACGTSFYAAKVGEIMFQECAGIDTKAEIASEFRYKKQVLDENTAAIFISQSGETADTLGALRELKKKGTLCLGITNVVGSSQARETDAGVYTRSGPEVAVASTKAFLGQLAVLTMMTVFFGRQKEMSFIMGKRIVSELAKVPNLAREVLKKASEIEKLAKKYKEFKNFWFIGRKYNFPIALEGALKLKEISYLHAEGVCGGELKHGPLALIDENFPTIAICPSDSVYDKMISSIQEIKARKGPVIAIATEGNEEIKKLVDDVIFIPKTLEMLTPMLSVIPLHLFAYYVAKEIGCEIDMPKNLAKAVSVE